MIHALYNGMSTQQRSTSTMSDSVRVPREPTAKMHGAGDDTILAAEKDKSWPSLRNTLATDCYKAMLAAAPAPAADVRDRKMTAADAKVIDDALDASHKSVGTIGAVDVRAAVNDRRSSYGRVRMAQEKGRWTVREHDGDVYVESDDFARDACLSVIGDFTPAMRRSYAEKVAAIMNAATPFEYGEDT